MTYKVFGGTLSLTQSISQSDIDVCDISQYFRYIDPSLIGRLEYCDKKQLT